LSCEPGLLAAQSPGKYHIVTWTVPCLLSGRLVDGDFRLALSYTYQNRTLIVFKFVACQQLQTRRRLHRGFLLDLSV